MTGFAPGLCSVTFRALTPAEIVPLAVEAGLRAIEWAGDAHVPPGEVAIARAVGRLSRAAGLAVSYGSYVAPPTDGMAAFEAVLDTAEALGATNIRLWPGTRGRPSTDYSPGEAAAAADLIAAMAGAAALRGVTVSLEYHPHSLTDETQSALRLIERIARANAFLYWQPRPGLALSDALAELGQVGRHVSHLHVFAWDAARTRYPLASASAYWRDVIAALPAGRWQGPRYAFLEFVAGDAPASFLADAASLREILSQQTVR